MTQHTLKSNFETVLLPPKGDGAAVLLETQEPERFVAEVRQKWSRRNPD